MKPLIPTIIPHDPHQPTSVVGLHDAATELAQWLTKELVYGPGYGGPAT